MAYSFSFPAGTPMELDEYVGYVAENVDIFDEGSLVESAEALHRLSLNVHLLQDIISAPVKEVAAGVQSQNIYTDATFILSADTSLNFFIRANVWKKPRALAGSFEFENKLYSYFQPHDHNFDFVTVGYYGPGYSTKIYEYDISMVVGRAGEHVPLRFLEDTTLPKGKVMLYRKSKDIHSQLPPESMSISLNLMIPNREQRYNQQYSFDLDNNRLAGFVDGHSSYRVSMLEIAGEIGDENTLDPLLDIAKANPCARARAEAAKAILKLAPLEKDRLMTYCGGDSSPLMKEAIGL